MLLSVTPWRVPQTAYLVVVGLVAAAAALPRVRAGLVAAPRRWLAVLVVADLAWFLWATVPFVPLGIDESYFAVNAHVLRGADLATSWIRTPLTVVGAALCPWHPPLVGLLLREVAIVLAFALARRGLGDGAGLLAAFWTAIATHLAQQSGDLLSEPYGAAMIAAFALAFARGSWPLAAVAGGLAFTARFQLGYLLPFALWVGWRRGRWQGLAGSAVLFALPILCLAPLCGSDPWRAFTQEAGRTHTVAERLLAYARPDSGFGLGAAGLLLALLGVASLLRAARRRPELVASAVLFVAGAAGIVGIGVITTRFFAPLVPLGAVLMVAGAVAARERVPALRRRGVELALLVAVSVSIAVPARVPKARHLKQTSPIATVVAARAQLLALLGDAPLYTDLDVLATTAALGHPCHAVLWAGADQPEGVSLDWEGRFPAAARDAVPTGAFYLTVDAAGRAPLWRRGDLALVRW